MPSPSVIVTAARDRSDVARLRTEIASLHLGIPLEAAAGEYDFAEEPMRCAAGFGGQAVYCAVFAAHEAVSAGFVVKFDAALLRRSHQRFNKRETAANRADSRRR